MAASAEDKEAMHKTAEVVGTAIKDAGWDSGVALVQHQGSIAMMIHAKPDKIAENLVDVLHGAHTAIIDMMERIGIKPHEGNHIKGASVVWLNGTRIPAQSGGDN